MKILVCEDDRSTLHFLDKMLQKMGLETILTTSGQEAVMKLCSLHPPRMAILDWVVPEYTGVEICKKVRQRSTLISTHIIILTSRDQPQDIVDGFAAGANDYVTKPFEPTELRARVEVGMQLINLREEVKTLTGLLPICSWCKKIRDEKNDWVRMEEYVEKNSYAQFSHGGCPECMAKWRAENQRAG